MAPWLPEAVTSSAPRSLLEGKVTVMERAWVAVTAVLSATWIVKLAVPVAVGVPVMAPVEVLRLTLAGSDHADTDNV